MVQASDEQSRKTHDEARKNIEEVKGLFWCHERKDFFKWEEFINYKYKEE